MANLTGCQVASEETKVVRIVHYSDGSREGSEIQNGPPYYCRLPTLILSNAIKAISWTFAVRIWRCRVLYGRPLDGCVLCLQWALREFVINLSDCLSFLLFLVSWYGGVFYYVFFDESFVRHVI